MSTISTFTSFNLQKVLEELFLVLTAKEKEVVIKRFSLDNGPKQTLEKIGQHFAVTRERIRQIEKIALNKLKRTVQSTQLKQVNEIANQILSENGNIMLESSLVNEVLKRINSTQDIEKHIVKLALNVNDDIKKTEKSVTFKPFWHTKKLLTGDIKQIIEGAVKLLKSETSVMKAQDLAQTIKATLEKDGKTFDAATIVSALEVDNRLKKVPEGFGLMSWRHINPRSIRDKAQIILKKATKPLHFVDIANKITEAGFDKKVVTVQAVHNELIRYEEFVLVGRGLYALKEWGYEKGTVADVIESLLKQKSPMTKQEIIEGVLSQRKVKKGTISLNLQKNPQFARVGRAVYAFDASKK
jgi:DNA-directed RNA polymerase delta subunit